MACDPQTLINNASCIACNIPNGMQLPVLIYLLCQIQSNGGSGAAGGVTCGNYSGVTPNFTPSSGCGMAIDTSTRELWAYFSGAWHDTVLQTA